MANNAKTQIHRAITTITVIAIANANATTRITTASARTVFDPGPILDSNRER